jgi:peptidyl-prolyl cis-trans isomerase C
VSTQPKKKSVGVMAITATLLIGLIAGGATYYWSTNEAYAAKVNGEVIPTTEYLTVLERAKKQYAGQIGMDFNSEAGRNMLTTLKKNIMDSLVDMTLMKQQGKEMNITTTDDEIATQIKEFIKVNYKGDEGAFQKDLEKNKFTRTEFETQMRDRLLLNKIYQKVIEKSKVTDADMKKFYGEHPEMFQKPEMIEAQHILIAIDDKKEAEALKKAKDITRQIKGGASFDEMARKHSTDASNKDNGGSLGSFKKGDMVPEFEKAAWDLKPGSVTSEPVKTQFGFHIIKRGASLPASTVSFEESKSAIQMQLEQQKQKDTFETWLKDLKAKATIKVNENMLATPEVASKEGEKSDAPANPMGEGAPPPADGAAAPPPEGAAPPPAGGDGHNH